MVSRHNQRQSVEKTVKALADSLEDEHEALIATALGLADAVDDDPSNAALWREMRAALNDLRLAAAEGGDDDSAQFLALVTTPMRAKVGNAKKS